MPAPARLGDTWRRLTGAQRDLIGLALLSLAAWGVIEWIAPAGRLFRWIVTHPQYRYDSLLLALIIAAFSVSVFALRRYDEMVAAEAARQLAEDNYHRLANHDPLTGLANRRALTERLEQANRTGEALGLIMLDLDKFKGVNDLHGHGAGDRLLVQVAERIVATLGEGPQAFRLGGDEFAVVVPEPAAGGLLTNNTARRLVRALGHAFDNHGLVHHIGASAGIAHHPADGRDPVTLLRAADMALYAAKESGRACFRPFEPAMEAGIHSRARLEEDVRRAVRNGEFVPFYQPLVSLLTGDVVGYEILARWNRDDGSEVSPAEFIPIAEECGLLNDLMFALLDSAFAEARGWDSRLTLEVNLSPGQFRDPWISERLLASLARNNFPAGRFGIEFTENAMLAEEDNCRRVIKSLKNQGARIALDDFGTGYSSLHHLRTLPLDRIKIDRSFITDLTAEGEGYKIVKAMVGLARSLDLPVTAEGVETAELARLLRNLGCSLGQGYFFGRPLPGAAVAEALRSEPKRRIA